VKYDVIADSAGLECTGAAAGLLAQRLTESVWTKGYCVANLGVSQDLLSSALRQALQLEADAPDRFEVPPAEVADGLLGEEGSCQIFELDSDSALPSDMEDLRRADALLTRVGDLVRAQDTEVGPRSSGFVHIAGVPVDDAPKLTEHECQRWLNIFGKHRLMVLFVLGPVGGKLELAPFHDEEANPIEVSVEPGSTIILRADVLSHTFTSLAKTLLLTCWLGPEGVYRAHDMEAKVMSPQYLELFDWKQQRLSKLKDSQIIGEDGQEWDPAVPKEWQGEANKAFHTGPQIGIRSFSGKLPSSHDPAGFWTAINSGMDFIEEVPMTRWSHTEFYDPLPISWKYGKTCCRHSSFVDGLEFFDCKFFGISPYEAKGMDPNQRHILETSYEALSSAGYVKKALMRSLIGVYIAAAVSEFGLVPLGPESQGATSGANSITSNRISFCLGMQGPSYTLDNQGAGVLSALTAGFLSLRMQTSYYKPNHTCLIGGTYLQLAPGSWILASSQGWLSPTGRCLAFDYSADGYVKGDGVGNTVISPLSEQVDGKDVVDESQPLLGRVASTTMNHTGKGASLTAPHGPQESDLVCTALRQASISSLDVDGIESWGDGAVLRDAVEIEALKGALRGKEESLDTPLAISTGKSQYGMSWESAGMSSLIRVVLGQRHGCMAGGLHIYELNPHIELWSGEEPFLFHSEVIPNKGVSSYHGISAKSLGGVMAHSIIFAEIAPEHLSDPSLSTSASVKPIALWPGGGGALDADSAPASAQPYHVIGSWSEWSAESMQSEGPGVYTYKVKMGPNGFEQFQIVLDGHADRVLHPDVEWAQSGVAALGPNPAEECSHLRWTIHGHGFPPGPAANLGESEAIVPHGDAQIKGYKEPIAPGALVRIRLRIAGKWRAVDWEKIAEPDTNLSEALDDGRYYIVGSFNNWTIQDEMRPVGNGCFQAEVGPLSTAGGEFQIVRNQDWYQTFHPAPHDRSKIAGPSESPSDLWWSLQGMRGDRFQVEFQRTTDSGGTDSRAVSWTKIRQ